MKPSFLFRLRGEARPVVMITWLFLSIFLFQSTDCFTQIPSSDNRTPNDSGPDNTSDVRTPNDYPPEQNPFIPKIVEASFDIAKLKEGGYSATKYNGKTGFNFSLVWAQAIAFALNTMTNDLGYADKKAGRHYILSLAETLQFIQKGAKDKEGSGKINVNYIEALIDFVYQYNSVTGSVYAGLGPYLGYGLSGKFSGDGASASIFGSDFGYKRFDAGLHAKVGYMLRTGLNVSVGYELGLINNAPGDSDYTSKNRAVSFNVGYSIAKLFGMRKKK